MSGAMRILSWNCQGLGNPWTGRSLRKLVREQTPNVCFLMETRLNTKGFNTLYGNLPFQNNIIVKHLDGGGGLAFLWKNDLKLKVINYTANHVLARVTEEDGFVWFMTGFYGWPETQQKFKSWKLLEPLKTFVEGPFLCFGDFNAILHSSEKQCTKQPHTAQIDAFRQALDICQLEDLGYKGYPFTWTNKRPSDANTKLRLDRVMATKGWIDNFPISNVVHLLPHASDHIPITIHVQKFRKKNRRADRGFKFEESWLLWDDCKAQIQQAWNLSGNGEKGLAAIHAKIRACGDDLKTWGDTKAKPEEKETKVLQDQLDEINRVDTTKESKEEYLVVSKKLDDLLLKQEIYWAQRSKVAWLKYGDSNTKFF